MSWLLSLKIHFHIRLNSSGQTLESTSKVHKYFPTDIKCPCVCIQVLLPFSAFENFQVSGALRFILNDKHVGCCVCRGRRRIDTFTYLSADLSLLAICSGDWNYLLCWNGIHWIHSRRCVEEQSSLNILINEISQRLRVVSWIFIITLNYGNISRTFFQNCEVKR